MLVNIHHDTKREHLRLLVAGVAFLTTIALLIGLSIAIYDKKFVSVTMVTVKADRAGLQLSKFGDVRRNGVLVGQVRAISQDGDQAVIKIALDPSAADQIPANVGVQILPTTLFGQKFVSLVTPQDPSPAHLEDGDVIPASRVTTNVELSRILANLFPLLRAVRPGDLNMTLSAIADALEGRGAKLGETLDQLGSYLQAIDGELPTLKQDLVQLAAVADDYNVAAPDLLDTLGNLTVTAKTVTEKKAQLKTFFAGVIGLSDTATRVLSENEDSLIRVGELTKPVLHLLATYSPELPCLIRGAARYAPILAKTFAGNQVKQYIELGTAQYHAYSEKDLPKYGEVGHGPWCAGLPNPPVPIGPNSFDDGTDIDSNPPTSPLPVLPLGRSAPAWATGRGFAAGMSSGYAGTEGSRQIVNALLADGTGRSADSYGSLGSLVYGPVLAHGGAS